MGSSMIGSVPQEILHTKVQIRARWPASSPCRHRLHEQVAHACASCSSKARSRPAPSSTSASCASSCASRARRCAKRSACSPPKAWWSCCPIAARSRRASRPGRHRRHLRAASPASKASRASLPPQRITRGGAGGDPRPAFRDAGRATRGATCRLLPAQRDASTTPSTPPRKNPVLTAHLPEHQRPPAGAAIPLQPGRRQMEAGGEGARADDRSARGARRQSPAPKCWSPTSSTSAMPCSSSCSDRPRYRPAGRRA